MPIEIETKQKVAVSTMQDLLESKYNDGPILERITAIESQSGYDDTDILEKIAAIEARLDAIETAPEEPPADDPEIVPDPPGETPVISGNGNDHFNAITESPNLIKSFTLRDVNEWLTRRNGTTTEIVYSPELDACWFRLPPRANEGGGFMFYWPEFPWQVDDRLVVQHDFLLHENMFGGHDVGGKMTNLCRGDEITYELNPGWARAEPCPFQVRCYVGKLEGRTERDELASDVADPTRTYWGKGGGYDENPGPDSTRPYGSNYPHPKTFRAFPNEWVRVTYELHHVAEGTRFKMWLANENTDPALIIASPIDSALGFLTNTVQPITGFYAECDSSQERTYDVDQPVRQIAFRNLAVLSNVNGEDVLGGSPVK